MMTKEDASVAEQAVVETEAPAFDTTTPAFGKVTKFTQADWPRYANWLTQRMTLRWPQLHPKSIPSILTGYMQANDSCFVKTHMTCSLARLVVRPFQSPVVEVLFTFANGRETLPEVTASLRFIEAWARRLGAVKLYADMESDIAVGHMKQALMGRDERVLVRDLVK